MQRVAFDLRRPALVALDEQPGGDAAERHRGRVEERLAGDELFGLSDVGDDLSGGCRVQARDARERERRAHQLQERAALDRIGDRFDLRRETRCAGAPGTPDRRASLARARRQNRLDAISCPSRFIGDTSNSS